MFGDDMSEAMVVMLLLYTIVIALASIAPRIFIASLHMNDFKRIRECLCHLGNKIVQLVLLGEIPNLLLGCLHLQKPSLSTCT